MQELDTIVTVDGRTLTVDEHGVLDHRREFGGTIDPVRENEVQIAMSWLANAPRIKKPREGCSSSYGLKHMFEDRLGYITNGAFIVAASRLGFPIWHKSGPNVTLAISVRWTTRELQLENEYRR